MAVLGGGKKLTMATVASGDRGNEYGDGDDRAYLLVLARRMRTEWGAYHSQGNKDIVPP